MTSFFGQVSRYRMNCVNCLYNSQDFCYSHNLLRIGNYMLSRLARWFCDIPKLI